MAKKKLSHVNRPLTEEERQRHVRIQQAAHEDFPPTVDGQRQPSPPGIPSQIRQMREAQGLTWYALAQLACIPNQGTIRDIEHGKDVKLSSLQAVASALGLTVELVEQG